MTLEWSLLEAKLAQRWVARGTEPGELKATPSLPCVPVLSGCRRDPNLISLRCKCMAGTWRTPSDRYFNYDRLGLYASLPDARAAYATHLRQRKAS